MSAPARTQKTALILIHRIVADITGRGLGADDQLASEQEMMEIYSVSRGTLREALRLLEMQGVVYLKPGPGGGAFVGTPDERALASMIALLLEFSGGRYHSILEARLVLEPALAQLSAERADRRALDDIVDAAETLVANIDDIAEFPQRSQAFHNIVAISSGNELLAYFVTSLPLMTESIQDVGIEYLVKRRDFLAGSYLRIAEAISNREGERSYKVMREYIAAFVEYLAEEHRYLADRPFRWEDATRHATPSEPRTLG